MVLCSLGMPYDPVEQPAHRQIKEEGVLSSPWGSLCSTLSCIEALEGQFELLPVCGWEETPSSSPSSSPATAEGAAAQNPRRMEPASCGDHPASDGRETSSCSFREDEDEDDLDEEEDLVHVIVPPGIKCGRSIRVSAHDGTGRTLTAVVPPGVSPWSSFAVRFPPLPALRRRRRRRRKGETLGSNHSSPPSPLSKRATVLLLGCGGCIEIDTESVDGGSVRLEDEQAEGAIRQFEDELRLEQEVTLVEEEEEEKKEEGGGEHLGECFGCWAPSPPPHSIKELGAVEAGQRSPDCVVEQPPPVLRHLLDSAMPSELPRSA